jgi:FkbM family methyltransferase
VDRNGLQNIHPNNCALGDEVMTSRLRIGIEDSGHSSLGPHPELSADDAIEIPVLPFDMWRRQAGLELPTSPSWVAKIDVEGYECHVIGGMREALAARAFRGLAVEVNSFALEFCGASAAKLISLLESMGYVERPVELPGERSTMNKFFVPRG